MNLPLDCVLDTVWITNTQFASCGADGMIFVMDINQATPLKTFTFVFYLVYILCLIC